MTSPAIPVPIRAVLLSGSSNVGDRNLLLHTARELGAGEILETHRRSSVDDMLENARDIASALPHKPCFTIFMSLGVMSSHRDHRGMVGALKQSFAPAIWLNMMNDLGAVFGTLVPEMDLEVMPQTAYEQECAQLESYNGPAKLASFKKQLASVLKLDAIPAAPPDVTREKAKRWFWENHQLALKGPVTLVALGRISEGEALARLADTCSHAQGSVLVTTGPRTVAPKCAYKTPGDQLDVDFLLPPGWQKLYDSADFIHVFNRPGVENPYPYMLAVADQGIVTADSMSLPSDFIAARIPLLIEEGSAADDEMPFAHNLIKEGYANRLTPGEPRWPRLDPDRPLPIDIVRRRFAQIAAQKLKQTGFLSAPK